MALPVSSDWMEKTENVISNSENALGNNLPGTGYFFPPSLHCTQHNISLTMPVMTAKFR